MCAQALAALHKDNEALRTKHAKAVEMSQTLLNELKALKLQKAQPAHADDPVCVLVFIAR